MNNIWSHVNSLKPCDAYRLIISLQDLLAKRFSAFVAPGNQTVDSLWGFCIKLVLGKYFSIKCAVIT